MHLPHRRERREQYGDPRRRLRAYSTTRGALAVSQAQLPTISVPSAHATCGFHPNLGRLHALWQAHRLAVVTNVGPLVAPLTRSEYLKAAATADAADAIKGCSGANRRDSALQCRRTADP